MITSEEVRQALKEDNYYIVVDYIDQQETLTIAVKRYFELKAKGITTEAEALEHRELLSKLYEMVGIEE